MEPIQINQSGISELHQEKVPFSKIKKVQFLGDTAIVIIDKALVEQLAIDNKTYLREEITKEGSIVLRVEPPIGYTGSRMTGEDVCNKGGRR